MSMGCTYNFLSPLFPIPFFISPCLFYDCQLCFFFPVHFPPIPPSSSPLKSLHVMSISLILILLICLLITHKSCISWIFLPTTHRNISKFAPMIMSYIHCVYITLQQLNKNVKNPIYCSHPYFQIFDLDTEATHYFYIPVIGVVKHPNLTSFSLFISPFLMHLA